MEQRALTQKLNMGIVARMKLVKLETSIHSKIVETFSGLALKIQVIEYSTFL